MAQTLEQVNMRSLPLGDSRNALERVERGMRNLAEAIGEVLRHNAADKATPSRPAARADAGATLQLKVRPASPVTAAGPQAPTAATTTSPAANAAPRSAAPRPARTAAAAAPQGMLQGSNDTMPLRSVFQFLSRTRKSGTLQVTVADEHMTFDLSDGCLVGTTSNKPPRGERTGDLVIEKRFAEKAEVEPSMARFGDSMQFGASLLKAGRITEGQLLEVLELQVQRRFRRAVAAQKATYDFREAPRSRGDGRIRIRPFEL